MRSTRTRFGSVAVADPSKSTARRSSGWLAASNSNRWSDRSSGSSFSLGHLARHCFTTSSHTLSGSATFLPWIDKLSLTNPSILFLSLKKRK
jgi:hypothetical protein